MTIDTKAVRERASARRPSAYGETDATVLALCDALDESRTEVVKLRAWVADLQAGVTVNCVYCGHRYGPDPGTPVAMADVLKAHVETCPKHPMSTLRATVERVERERDALRDALKSIAFDPFGGSEASCPQVLDAITALARSFLDTAAASEARHGS